MAAFDTLYRHRMVRVAAFAPRVALADPAANREAILTLAREAHERHAALALFPELALTGYSVEDLHHQSALLDASEAAAGDVIAASADLFPVIVLGCALRQHGQIFNCALFVHRGRLLGVVPKSYLPTYREFYEKRWFSDATGVLSPTIAVAGHEAPFGTDLVFEAADLPGFVAAADICEDFWAPVPPSTDAALAGASVIVNLSASNATIGKARERAVLIDAHSRRTCAAYVFCAAGAGESTNDLAWDGQLLVYEQGVCLAQGERFLNDHARVYADIDLERIEQDRLRLSTFRDAAARAAPRLKAMRRVRF